MLNHHREKKGHRRLFYTFIFVLSILFAVISVFDVFFIEGTRGDKIYETLMIDFSVALLLIVVLFGLKRFAILNEEAEETLSYVKDNHETLNDVHKNSLEMISIFSEHLHQNHKGYSYSDRTTYYREYYSLVTEAEKTVQLVGDGFRCHTAQNEARALGLYQAMKDAHKNGVIVSRFQYHNTLSIKWLILLLDLVESDCGHDKFRIFMNQACDPTTIPYVICLTDTKEQNASINIMFTMNADTQLEEKLGGPAFIFRNAQECSENMGLVIAELFNKAHIASAHVIRNMISTITTEREAIITKHITENTVTNLNIDAVKDISKAIDIPDIELIYNCIAKKLDTEIELYFSFGSNLLDSRIQVAERSPTAVCIDRGFISDYELCFNMKGNLDQGKGGGIANIRPYKSRRVFGAIYMMDKIDFDRLQSREESMGYSTKSIVIDKRGFGKVTAKVFISTTTSKRHYQPTKNYGEFIQKGMAQNYFPDKYQAGINKLMQAV